MFNLIENYYGFTYLRWYRLHRFKYGQSYTGAWPRSCGLDDFSTGHEWAVKDCEILRVNLLDQDKLSQLLKGRYFDSVIHFAAKSFVGESVKT